jgi:hypothetical protein
MARNGDGMILEYVGPMSGKFTVKGPASGKTYRTMLTNDGMLLFDVHPEDADSLKQRTRKGKPLWVEFNVPVRNTVTKAEPVKTNAPKLPESQPVMDDIWADVPVKPTVEKVDNLEFDSVASFREWLETEPNETDLLVALTAEKAGKGRKTIIAEINKALNG